MKCEIHGTEMHYAGENPFGGDIWVCELCEDEEEYEVWHNDAYQQDHPEEFTELDDDDDFPDDFYEILEP